MQTACGQTLPVVLTIAGSDSGGGAGVQADLKAFFALGVFGTSAITCVTAQNPGSVRGVEAITPEMVALQIHTVCEAFPVAVAKTGMLYSEPIIRAVARAVEACRLPLLVVDPVMVATSGARLLREDAMTALKQTLIPMARVITPNLPEAEILCGRRLSSQREAEEAAIEIEKNWGAACVLKGGHADWNPQQDKDGHAIGEIVDILCDQGRIWRFPGPRVPVAETHGTGCTFSAALTALLAAGRPLATAVGEAKEFVGASLRAAIPAGKHTPLRPQFSSRAPSDGART